MDTFNKLIKIDDNKILQYDIFKDYIPLYIITSSNSEFSSIKFVKSGDYCFNSSISCSFDEYIKSRKQVHTFDKNHPLFIPLLHLLDGEEELIIDDDDTYELNEKYVKIYRNDKNINIDFINNLIKDDSIEKFNIFIKNIGFDLRSKIDCQNKDTKERLSLFFKEVYLRINEEYHQITLEEYLIDKGLLTKSESKKYVKKIV